MRILYLVVLLSLLSCTLALAAEPPVDLGPARIDGLPGGMENSLWGQNPIELQFGPERSKVVVADLKGPGVITVIHFAMPATLTADRALVLRIYWDGSDFPSVEAPMTDFFLDPNGELESVASGYMTKNRGWNCYLPMPFARSARIELEYETDDVGANLWSLAPCYAYVCWRPLERFPKSVGYFHANWNQYKGPLAIQPFPVLATEGAGRFVGCNLTLRGIEPQGCPAIVDEDFWLAVDGEDWQYDYQGIEDFTGFSWGFPPAPVDNFYYGWHPFRKEGGFALYRWMLPDGIYFKHSLKGKIALDKGEDQTFQSIMPSGYELESSCVCYWYQAIPGKANLRFPGYEKRLPSLTRVERAELAKQLGPGKLLHRDCGRPVPEAAIPGFKVNVVSGFSYNSLPGDITWCWAGEPRLELSLKCPKGFEGTLRLFCKDADDFQGGRKQALSVGGQQVAALTDFQEGVWVETPLTRELTAEGRVPIVITNNREGANVVISTIEVLE